MLLGATPIKRPGSIGGSIGIVLLPGSPAGLLLIARGPSKTYANAMAMTKWMPTHPTGQRPRTPAVHTLPPGSSSL
jgi:hypothetical protein